MKNIHLNGSGSIACGKDSIAVGERGVAAKGNMNGNVIITGDQNYSDDGSQNTVTSKAPHTFIENHSKSVFISYSHGDSEFALKLKHHLELVGIECLMDVNSLSIGSDISAFIENAVYNTDYTIAIISKNSLRSAWVIKEYFETMMHEHVHRSKKFIPVYIDKSLFDDAFFIETLKSIQKEMDQLKHFMNDDIVKDVKIPNLTTKYDRLMTLKQGLGEFFQQLNNTLVADFATDDLFNENVDQLTRLLKGND